MWGLIIGKYHPTFIGDCKKAIKWSEEMVREWLKDNMFHDKDNKDDLANNVVAFLSSHSETYSHQKHIHFDKLKELGLSVVELENLDNEQIDGCRDLQDCVLTLHHTYMQTFANSNAVKMIENHTSDGLAVTLVEKR